MALDKQFVLRLESSTHGKLTERASEENLSINMLLNRLVSLYLEGKIDIKDNQVTDENIQNWEKLEGEIEQIKRRLELLESRYSQEYINDKPLVQVVVKEDSSVTEEYLSSSKALEDKSIPDNSELSSLNEIKYISNDNDSDNSTAIDIELGESQKRSEIEEESNRESNELPNDINIDGINNIDSTFKGELEEDVMTDSGSSLSKVLEQNVSESQIKQALDEDTDKNNIDNDSSSNTDSNKEELKDVGLEGNLWDEDNEGQMPGNIRQLFDEALEKEKEGKGSGKVRRKEIVNTLGLELDEAKKLLWWSDIDFDNRGWGKIKPQVKD
jgi:hypothetical protein